MIRKLKRRAAKYVQRAAALWLSLAIKRTLILLLPLILKVCYDTGLGIQFLETFKWLQVGVLKTKFLTRYAMKK